MARTIQVVGIAAALVAVVVPAALAQSAVNVYGGQGGNVQGAVAGTAGGTLPFTGMSLALVIAAAVAIVTVGLALRRSSRATQ